MNDVLRAMNAGEYHLDLIRSAREHLRYPWAHFVTDFERCWDTAAIRCDIIVTEFADRYCRAPITLTWVDLELAGDSFRDLLRCQLDVAFMALSWQILETWRLEVPGEDEVRE